jgi:hypothetical protein
MEFARSVWSNSTEQRNESAKKSTKDDAAWRDLNFRSSGFAEGPLNTLNGGQLRSVARVLSALVPRAHRPAGLLRYRSSI